MSRAIEPTASVEAVAPQAARPQAPLVPAAVPGRLAGALAALLAGASSLAISRFFVDLEPIASLAFLPLLGIGVAAGVGSILGPKVERRTRASAIAIALVYGALVPAIVAAVITLPAPIIVPIAVGVSVAAWPLSMPAALLWLGLLRFDATRQRLERPRFALLTLLAAALLIGWRFTVPLTIRSATGETCISLPGESIEDIAWSPDGMTLAFASSRDFEEMSISVVEPATGRFDRVTTGRDVLGDFGLIVSDDGSVVYGADRWSPTDAAWLQVELRSASRGTEPIVLGQMPVLGHLIGTVDGPAAVFIANDAEALMVDWVNIEPAGIVLERIADADLAQHPEIGLAARELMPGDPLPIEIQLDGVRHEVDWPADATSEVSITPDHRWLIFVASRLTTEGDSVEQLVATSVETGERRVLLDGPVWRAEVGEGYVARLAFPNPGNRLCVGPLGSTLT